jgi:3-hydroxyisobutyrate dehydrogenase
MRIAWLGLGAMGRRMARRLADSGYELVVYNRTPVADECFDPDQVRVASSPAEAAEGAEAVFSMVTGDEASRSVWTADRHGALRSCRPGTVIVECSSLSVQWIRELREAGAVRACQFACCPVAGSLPQADQGALHGFLGAVEPVRRVLKPALAAYSARISELDSPEHAAAIKLATNAWLAAQVASLAESLSLARGNGVPPAVVHGIFSGLSMMSPALAAMLNLIAAGDHAPRFPIRLVSKDLRYALPEGAGVLHEVARRFELAATNGHEDSNITAIAL